MALRFGCEFSSQCLDHWGDWGLQEAGWVHSEHPEVSSTWASIQEGGIQDLYQPKREVGVRWGWGLALGSSAQVGWPGRPGTRCGSTAWSTELGGRSLLFPLRSFQWVCRSLLFIWRQTAEKQGLRLMDFAPLSHNFGKSGLCLWHLAERMSVCGTLNPQRWSVLGLKSKFPFL